MQVILYFILLTFSQNQVRNDLYLFFQISILKHDQESRNPYLFSCFHNIVMNLTRSKEKYYENAFVICHISTLLPTSTELVSVGGHMTRMACSHWLQLCTYTTQGLKESFNLIKILKWCFSFDPPEDKYCIYLSKFWSSLIKMLKEAMLSARMVNILWIYIQNQENSNFSSFFVLKLQEQFDILELSSINRHDRLDWG